MYIVAILESIFLWFLHNPLKTLGSRLTWVCLIYRLLESLLCNYFSAVSLILVNLKHGVQIVLFQFFLGLLGIISFLCNCYCLFVHILLSYQMSHDIFPLGKLWILIIIVISTLAIKQNCSILIGPNQVF